MCSIEATYKISFHFISSFPRQIIFKISTNGNNIIEKISIHKYKSITFCLKDLGKESQVFLCLKDIWWQICYQCEGKECHLWGNNTVNPNNQMARVAVFVYLFLTLWYKHVYLISEQLTRDRILNLFPRDYSAVFGNL